MSATSDNFPVMVNAMKMQFHMDVLQLLQKFSPDGLFFCHGEMLDIFKKLIKKKFVQYAIPLWSQVKTARSLNSAMFIRCIW